MSIFTCAAVLYNSKTLSNGEHPILIRLYDGNKRKYISTGYSSNKIQWDEKKQRPKRSHPFYSDVIAILDAKIAEVSKLKTLSSIAASTLNVSDAANKIIKGKNTNATLFAFFKEHELDLATNNQITYGNTFRFTRNSLTKFTGGKDPKFSEIDLDFLTRYEAYLKSTSVKTTTISVYFRTFRTLFKLAIEKSLCPESHYPFKKFDFSDYNDPETISRGIDKKQLKKLFALRFKKQERKYLVLQLFKFSYYASGMNFIDMALLQWKNITKDVIEYTRAKTDKKIIIGLTPELKKILNEFREITFQEADAYVFPILKTHYGSSSKEQTAKYKRIATARGNFNRDLKELAQKAKLDFNITSYTARHSFAYNSYNYGVDKKYIGEALGHRYEKVTNKYLGKLNHKDIAQKIQQALK